MHKISKRRQTKEKMCYSDCKIWVIWRQIPATGARCQFCWISVRISLLCLLCLFERQAFVYDWLLLLIAFALELHCGKRAGVSFGVGIRQAWSRGEVVAIMYSKHVSRVYCFTFCRGMFLVVKVRKIDLYDFTQGFHASC